MAGDAGEVSSLIISQMNHCQQVLIDWLLLAGHNRAWQLKA